MSKEKRKKKSGSIAVPFLVTIFLGLLIVGGAMFGIYKYYFDKDEKPPEPPSRTGITTASPEDSHTILLILDESGNSGLIDKKTSYTFILMRSLPYKKRLLFVGIPSNSISIINGNQQSLKNAYEQGGANAAKDFVQGVLGTDVDKYMVFNSEAFRRICEIFGNVTYPVDVEISGLKGDGSMQNMSAEQIETYATYSLFKNGETERVFNAATILSYMINGSDGERIAGNLDRYFEEIINMISSDITSVEYEKKKSPIKYMFNYGSSIAISIIIDGETSGDDFIPSRNFIENLPEEYFSDDPEAK